MANEDVRVRLSAEGVQDVVAALRKIDSEARKAGKGGDALTGAFRQLKGILPTLTIGAVLSFSGPASFPGEEVRRGLTLARENRTTRALVACGTEAGVVLPC